MFPPLRARAASLLVAALVLLGGSVFTWAHMDVGDGRLVPYAGMLERDGLPEDGNFTLRFGLFTSAAADATCLVTESSPSCPLWSEEQQDILVSAGRFSATLGSNSTLSDAHLDTTPLYLAVAVKRTDEAGFALMESKQELLAVPFAARAAAAKNYKVTGNLTVGGGADVNGVVTASAVSANVAGLGSLNVNTTRATVTSTSDVGPTTGGGLIVQHPTSGANLGIDTNEIMARVSDGPSRLHLNNEGGEVFVGGGGLRVTGSLTLANSVEVHTSGANESPEVYKLTDPSLCTIRGEMFIGRASQSSVQDSLCVCLKLDDHDASALRAWCFNP